MNKDSINNTFICTKCQTGFYINSTTVGEP